MYGKEVFFTSNFLELYDERMQRTCKGKGYA